MQPPTCSGLHVRKPYDAHVIFHAVTLGILPMVARRLDTDERRNISSGCVFVWEERGPNAEATGLGIERWTDSIHWGPSRVRDEFLFYHEKKTALATDLDMTSDSSDTTTRTRRGPYRPSLIKQTYSVFVETFRGRRKWHLIAYFTQETLHQLHTIDDIPALASLNVPLGTYRSARNPKQRPRDQISFDHRSLLHYQPQVSRTTQPPHAVHRKSSILLRHDESNATRLAPLQYLESIAPQRRHILDEMALMSLPATI
ncbi:Gti1/Pac2 family-domain-containing protein [Crassisporium funariophilum]|nr:Gti1/Pac2 family-domain-containing protein [Crassisporium funariophilum]